MEGLNWASLCLCNCLYKHGLRLDGSMVAAVELFQEMVGKKHPFDDIKCGIAMVEKSGKALELLEKMYGGKTIKPSVGCFSLIIDCLYKEGRTKEAFSLFQDIINLGVVPDVVTYTPLVCGLCKLGGRSEEAKRFLIDIDMLASGILVAVL